MGGFGALLHGGVFADGVVAFNPQVWRHRVEFFFCFKEFLFFLLCVCVLKGVSGVVVLFDF